MPGVDASEDALDRLLDALSAQAVSEPIQIEGKIIIPVHKIALGIGIRIIQANEAKDGEEGAIRHAAEGAAGCGMGISPVAVLIISNASSGPDGVKVVPLSLTGESLFGIAGDLMDKIGKRKKKGEEETGDMAAIIIE